MNNKTKTTNILKETTPKWHKTFLKWFWGIFSAGIIIAFVAIWMIAEGWLGYLPPLEELQNPKNRFASEIISSDMQSLGRYYRNENRVGVQYTDLSPYLIDALVATEDARFYNHTDDPKYPTAYILGQKALDYCDYFPESSMEPAYGWLKQSVEGMGVKSQMQVLAKFVDVSYALFKSDNNKYGEQFIADYELASELLSQQAADPTNKNAKFAAQQKDYVDNVFAVSGAADCSKLDEIYAQVVTDNAQNLDMLGKVITLYKRVKCTESDVYFAACENSHRLQPTEESAAGCARMSAKKGDYREAINYYEEAISRAQELDVNDEDIADYQYNIALIYFSNLKNYPQARAYARQSLSSKEDQGRCYILIGLCYAATQPYSTANYPAAKAAILNKTVYWAAVDKFIQAKQVDPDCTADADKLIAAYSKYFPTKEEMFDLPNELGGATFTVGGWIGETTACRAAH